MAHSCRTVIAGLLLAGLGLAAQQAEARDTRTTPACRAYDAQVKAEQMALDLIRTPEMQQARVAAATEWRRHWGAVAPEAEALFPSALDELVFNAALKTVVNTARPPAMLLMINRPAGRGAMQVPGTRYGWDNTDNIYGSIPLDPQATYRISGQLTDPGTNLNLSIWTGDGRVLANLAKADLRTDADGHFTLTAGAGESYDIKLPLDAHHIMVRETMPDWANGKPVYLDVVQKSGPSPAAPSIPMMAKKAAAAVADMVVRMRDWRASLYRKYPANTFVQPWVGRTDNGGLPNQAYSIGYFQLADNEALVFDIGAGGAEYFSFQLSDIWGTSGNFVDNVSTLTNHQSRPNKDGSYTYVVSLRDPGIENWISTQGWHEGDITLRWQQLDGTPSVKVQRVTLDKLAAVLPPGTPSFSGAQRKQQIAARADNPYGKWMDGNCAR